MYLTIIIWALVCAIAIIAYPIYLFHRASKSDHLRNHIPHFPLETIMLFSYDLRNRPSGWSFTIEIPELNEKVLYDDIILFYLETDETCLKLPINNEALGYTANIFKNVGKIYLTFKCIKDGVSNFDASMCPLKSLKMLIIKPNSLYPRNRSIYSHEKYTLYNVLRAAGVNIHNYEETLEHLSNFCTIDFKGHRKNCISVPFKNRDTPSGITTKTNYLSHMP